MATIIDSLLVTLGLDDKPYKKGAAEADRAQKQFKDNTKKSSLEIEKSLKGVALQLAAMVIGFQSIRGAIGFMAGINNADAALGRLAKNTGENVHAIKTWANAADLAGGTAADAQADISKLSADLTAFTTQGVKPESLVFFQRMGIGLQDAQGKTKGELELLTELGGKLRDLPRPTAYNLGRSAGFSDSSLNLLLESANKQKEYFALAEKNNRLDEARAKQAQQLQTTWRSLLQSAEDFGRVLLEKITPGLMGFFHALEPIKPILVSIIDKITKSGAFEAAGNAMVKIAEYAERAVDALLKLKGAATGEPGEKRVIDSASPTAASGIFDVPGKGETQAEYDLRLRRRDTRRREVELERQQYGVSAAARLASEQIKLAARNNEPGAAGLAQTLGIQIDQITINSTSADPAKVAAEIPAAINRKVSQAGSGMN